LDSDLDHLRRMNEVLAAHHGNVSTAVSRTMMERTVSEPIRKVTPLAVCPSEDLAMVAERFAHRMPRLVRYMLDGLGRPDAQSADLTSYLLFDSAYTNTLLDIGYRDADARVDELESFLCADRRKHTARGKRRVRATARLRQVGAAR
jgi:NTE family protein